MPKSISRYILLIRVFARQAGADVQESETDVQEKGQLARYIGTVDNTAPNAEKKVIDEDVIVEQQKEALKRYWILL